MAESTIIIQVTHRDLGERYALKEITALHYAQAVVARARTPNGFLDHVPAATILSLVPGLPAEVVGCQDAEDMVAACIGFLGLVAGSPIWRVGQRIVFPPDVLWDALEVYTAMLVLEPYHHAAHPGHRFTAWLADHWAIEVAVAGPWYGASPQIVTALALDYLHQITLGAPELPVSPA